jgi:hypothetical protein
MEIAALPATGWISVEYPLWRTGSKAGDSGELVGGPQQLAISELCEDK